MEDNAVVCIAQLNCIQRLTPIIEYVYPLNLTPEQQYFPSDLGNIDFTNGVASTEDEYRECISLLPHLAFGDMNPSMTADVIYMIIPASSGRILYAISYYRRFNSYHIRGTDKVQITLWKSVCLLFRIPFFGAISARLKPIVLSHFINIASRDMSILEDAYHHINNILSGYSFQYEDLFFDLSNNEKSIVMSFEMELLTILIKAILLERRVVLYSKSAYSVTSNILALLGLIPAALTLGFPSNYFGRESLVWQKYGLPLKIFHKDYPLMLLCPKNMIGVITSKKGYLVGITDITSFQRLEKPVDILIDLDSVMITLCNKNIYWITYTTLHEECFFISSIFDDEIFKEVFSAAKESSRVAINMVGAALAKVPSGLITLARFSTKNDDNRLNDERETIFEFFDKLFPGATPKWLKRAIEPTPKPRKSKSNSLWQPFVKKLGLLSIKDKSEKSVKNKEKQDKNSLKMNKLISSIESSKVNSFEDELKVISEFESRVGLIHEYIMVLLQKSAYIATNERDVNYITANVDYDCQQSNVGVGYVLVTMRALDTDVLNQLNIEFNKKVRFDDKFEDCESIKDCDNISEESLEEFNPEDSGDIIRDEKVDNDVVMNEMLDNVDDETIEFEKCYKLHQQEHQQHQQHDQYDHEGVEGVDGVDEGEVEKSGEVVEKEVENEGVEKSVDGRSDEDRSEEHHDDVEIRDDELVEISRKSKIRYKYVERYIPQLLADQIYELQNDYSYPFLDYWIDTENARQFVKVHNLHEMTMPHVKSHMTFGKIKTYTYSNGDQYKGTTKRMLRHGNGKYVSKKGTIYEGEWRKDKRDGYGILRSMNPFFYYSGNWKRDVKCGFGHLKTQFVEYWGQFENNQFNGSGIILYANGTTYEGGFKDGFYHGQGKLLENKLIKLGEFEFGKLVGTASIIYPTGCIYLGSVEHDIPNGVGYICYDSDHNFHGYWVNGMRFGPGVLSVQYKDDSEEKADSEDTVYIADTTAYKLKQATASLKPSQQVFASGWSIEAYWKDDLLDLTQQITIKYPNGDKYIGFMNIVDRNDLSILDEENYEGVLEEKILLPSGRGLFKSASGEVYDGEWRMGFSHGRGDGISFDGEFDMNLITGSGMLTLNSGEVLRINLDFTITRDQLIEIGKAKTSIEVENRRLKYEVSSFFETMIKYNPYNLEFMMTSKNFSELYGDCIKCSPETISNDS